MNNIPRDDHEHGLACGARALDCFSYVDPTTSERVGAKLVLQACLCPAAVLAANTSLLDSEDAASHSHGIPCADAFAIGPRGLQEYRRMCRAQLACGFACMGLPVVYTENLIQRQRIRSKYGLRDATSLSEIGAGCCYPCSIFQSHTLLYVSTHRPVDAPMGTTARHGPLIGALRAMQRGTPGSIRSKDIVHIQQGPREAGAVPSDPKPAKQSVASLHQSQVEAARAGETAPVVGCQPSMSLTAAAAYGGVSPSRIASSVGETPAQVVTLFNGGRPNGRPLERRVPVASMSSAESRSTPASSSIPPPEVTDSPRVGVPPVAPTFEESEAAESVLTDSASMPVPSALPMATAFRSPPKFEVPPAMRPPDSANSEVISAWMEGPKLSLLPSKPQLPADGNRHPSGQASSMGQSNKPSAGPTASGMSVSDASLFSLALEPGASCAPQLPLPIRSAAEPSVGAEASAASAAPVLPPSTLPPPLLRTPGSSKELQAAAYDTITSSKLSSLIDQAMLNGSAAGCGSGSAAGGGTTALSSMDPASPWDTYRHSVMAPIAEADAEDGPRSAKKPYQPPIEEKVEHSAASCGRDVPASIASVRHRLAPAKSRNSSQRHVNGLGSGAGSPAGLSIHSTQRTPGGGQRANGGGSALTTLARMGSGGSNNVIAVLTGGARASNVCSRNSRATDARPAPRRTPPAAVALSGRFAAAANVRDSNPRVAGAGGDDDDDDSDDVDDGMGASADNFSLAGKAPQQVLLHVSAQPMLRQGSSQGRYGAIVERPSTPTLTPTQRPAPTFAPIGDDDEVNLASIRPSFIDGPEMEHLKSILRTAGEKADASAAATSPAPAAAQEAQAGAVSLTASGSQRVVSLSSSVTTLQQRGSGSRRYSGAQEAPRSPVANARAGAFGGRIIAAPYDSFCGDAASPEGDTARDSLDEDASSIIDGPVSSGEGCPVIACRPMATESPRDGGEASSGRGDMSAGGDACVCVAVSEAPRVPMMDPAESAGFGLAGCSASGLSNGELTGGYESVVNSVCAASQHRQKHWVNWMAQSVGMSMMNSVANSSGVVRPVYGRPVGGNRSRTLMEQASSYLSVNQRLPGPVLEESSDDLYRQWG